MKTIGFQKKYSTDTDFIIVEQFEDGTSREGIDPNNYDLYKTWTDTIQNVSGNKYVTINADDTITYDLTSYEADVLSDQWICLINSIIDQLNDTAWYMLSDSALTSSQLIIATQWRKDIMNIPITYKNITDAQNEYNTLIETKPEYELKQPIL